MSEKKPGPDAPRSEEEEHRRRWLQYALQTPPPRPSHPANPNRKQASSRGPI